MIDMVGANYWRLPEGLRQRNQWCLAGKDKAPYLAGSNGLYRASPVQGPWLDFESALNLAREYKCGIGYIICESDPYTCIDLDVKDALSRDKNGEGFEMSLWTQPYELSHHCGIVEFAQSYTELSASGKGAHIWVEGDIGAGRNSKSIEVYSKERFIICTGNAIGSLAYEIIDYVAIPFIEDRVAKPIADGSLLLSRLIQELKTPELTTELVEVAQELSDEEIWRRASTAENKHKFIELCEGRYEQYGFPSQSEADLALMSMFTFYSMSNEQCRRLFRQTALGKRSKATKNDVYLNRNLQLIRARQEQQKLSEQNAAISTENLRIKLADAPKVSSDIQNYVKNLNQAAHSQAPDNVVDYQLPEVDGLNWPPGLVGAIAGFIYNSAPRPVKEVAIVAALGLMSGITGKAYNIGQTGLNLYIILVARSAIGKEAMHSGIGHILRSPCGQVLSPFVDFSDYASGPALSKAIEKTNSFVNVSGEWGRKLQRMSDDKRDGAMQQLRTVMTHLYQKSGSASVVGGIGYSDSEKNVQTVNAVSYSMIGETTPRTFYDSLTATMMEDGFLSRFNIIEYTGDRPPANDNQQLQVPKQIADAIANIASHCVQINYSPNGIAVQVALSQEAEKLIKEFDLYCDVEVKKAGSDESLRQVWNRAHLKVIRIAGVLAASDNHINPVVNESHAKWAIEVVTRDADSMVAKVTGGDIGGDDLTRLKKLLSILKEYLTKGNSIGDSYKISRKMTNDGAIPMSYISKRCMQVNCFNSHKLGANSAIRNTINQAIESGYLYEMDKAKVLKDYSYSGKTYMLIDIL